MTDAETHSEYNLHSWDKAFDLIAELLPLLVTRTAPEFRDVSPEFFETIRSYNLSPLVFRELTRCGLNDALPPVLLQSLRDDYAAAVRSSYTEEKQVIELLHALQEAAIIPILLKGVDIRQRLYGDSALRPMVDIDFMIAPEEIKPVQAILEKLGYRLSNSRTHPPEKFIRKFGFELLYLPPDGKPLPVEPHWEIGSAACQYMLPYEVLNESAQTNDYQGVTVKVLSPEHLLIHLCVHLYGDYGDLDYGDRSHVSPIHIIDIILVLDRLLIDWGCFLREVGRLGCVHPVRQILARILPLAPSLIPADVMAAMSDYRLPWHQRMLLRLRDGLRRVSPYVPWLRRHYRIWEMFTFIMADRRARRRVEHKFGS